MQESYTLMLSKSIPHIVQYIMKKTQFYSFYYSYRIAKWLVAVGW